MKNLQRIACAFALVAALSATAFSSTVDAQRTGGQAGYSVIVDAATIATAVAARLAGQPPLTTRSDLRGATRIVLTGVTLTGEEPSGWEDGGTEKKRDGTIVLKDADGKPVTTWNFYGTSFPPVWKIGDLDGSGEDMQVETVTMSVERMERATAN